DVVEIDVRMTKDGEIILLHDEDFSRVAGVKIKPRDYSLKELREKIRIGEDTIASLDEAISLIDGRVGLFIEIKEVSATNKVIEKVIKENAAEWVAIISFHDEVLKIVKRNAERIVTGLIYATPPGRIFDAKKLGAKIVLPRYPIATKKANNIAHKLRLKVVAWTINDLTIARKVLENGVDGIASDYPDRIITLREELRK
ncbi:MAG: glycerophosphodiester phosphodiesterase, partial [Candidatus Njordarchaeales archaeon]